MTRRSFLSAAGGAGASLAAAGLFSAGLAPGSAMAIPMTERAIRAANDGAHLAKADLIAVYKSRREMHLLRDGALLRRYAIALGANPTGHKMREGDSRTPEGAYVLDWRNPDSLFHLSLHVSYPNDTDRALAAARGVNPGGNIMIHGLPNGRDAAAVEHPRRDWTDGCIAITNEQIEETWARVTDGTGIVIFA